MASSEQNIKPAASVDEATVEKVARLARLHVAPADSARYAAELSAILRLVAHMDATAVDDVEPMAHPVGAVQRLRPDQVTETNQRDAFQALAPSTSDGLYLVPRVVE